MVLMKMKWDIVNSASGHSASNNGWKTVAAMTEEILSKDKDSIKAMMPIVVIDHDTILIREDQVKYISSICCDCGILTKVSEI